MEQLAPPASGPSQPDSTHLAFFKEFEAYPFSDDPEFKAGLPTVIRAIRGAKRTPGQIDEMIGRAQWFYYTRKKGVGIPWDTYAQYTRSPSSPPSPPSPSLPSQGSIPGPSTGSTGHNHPGGSVAVDSKTAGTGTGLNRLAESRRVMVQGVAASTGPDIDDTTEGGMSFAILCRLISEGRAGEVPGIKHIPDEINSEPPSIPTMAVRPKPWESQQPLNHSFSFLDNLSSNHVWDMTPLGDDLEQETVIPDRTIQMSTQPQPDYSAQSQPSFSTDHQIGMTFDQSGQAGQTQDGQEFRYGQWINQAN